MLITMLFSFFANTSNHVVFCVTDGTRGCEELRRGVYDRESCTNASTRTACSYWQGPGVVPRFLLPIDGLVTVETGLKAFIFTVHCMLLLDRIPCSTLFHCENVSAVQEMCHFSFVGCCVFFSLTMLCTVLLSLFKLDRGVGLSLFYKLASVERPVLHTLSYTSARSCVLSHNKTLHKLIAYACITWKSVCVMCMWVSIVNSLCLILMLSLRSHDQITVFVAQSLLVIEIDLRDNVSTLFATWLAISLQR